MPLRGGSAAKYGARYEDRWCAVCTMRVLAEDAAAIYIERPEPEYEGFEFSIETDTGIEYHQVKRQRTGRGGWTLSALSKEGVLGAFASRLHEADSVCVFVSANEAPELEELADRAGNAESLQQFTSSFGEGRIGTEVAVGDRVFANGGIKAPWELIPPVPPPGRWNRRRGAFQLPVATLAR